MQKGRGISRTVIIIIVAVAVVAIIGASLALEQQTKMKTTTPPSASTVQVVIPAGAGVPPSNWNGSHIISNQYYSPDVIVVIIGVNNTVQWVNHDSIAHTVTSVNGVFDSGNMQPGATFTYTFTEPGTYEYYCVYHFWMAGKVIVKTG
ncbi:MAG: cupredoxin domain-containing protein [Conexivisphaerales archaeon]